MLTWSLTKMLRPRVDYCAQRFEPLAYTEAERSAPTWRS
jgi:hypothetical protein